MCALVLLLVAPLKIVIGTSNFDDDCSGNVSADLSFELLTEHSADQCVCMCRDRVLHAWDMSVCVCVCVHVSVCVHVLGYLCVCEGPGLGLGLEVGVGEGVNLGVGVSASVGVGVSAWVCVSVCVRVSVCVCVCVCEVWCVHVCVHFVCMCVLESDSVTGALTSMMNAIKIPKLYEIKSN